MSSPFQGEAIAEGYARSRPPLHAAIVGRVRDLPRTSILDVGCGAGLSTAPLPGGGCRVVGVDPVPEMLRWARQTCPSAQFLAARAESLPFRAAAFDLVTAAGSLNYAEPARAFPELRRVVTDNGALVVYDFAQVDFPYERPAGGAIPLSPAILAQMDTGFRVVRAAPFEIPISLTHERYVAYLNTEVTVAAPPVQPVWNLVFRGYLAVLAPAR